MKDNKRQQQKNLTRQNIIEVAIKYFGANGITATKTADIAKAANVSHGTIFAHFATQEELLIAVISEFGNRVATRLHELLEDKDKSLLEILQVHINALIEFEAFYTRLVIERRFLPRTVTNTYIMIQTTISFHIEIAFEKEIAKGNIKEFPLNTLYNIWISMVNYYLSNGDLFLSSQTSPNQTGPENSILKKYGNELISNYMNLIAL